MGGLLTLSILFYFSKTYKVSEPVNFLLLGEGGAGHEGPDLTDTIMFGSVSRKGTVLVSLPRDLWYQPWQTKINTLYFYGQEKGDGLKWTKEIASEITGQKIDRVVLIDFAVFKDLVDLVGGVDVEIDKTFDDYRYPVSGKEKDPCDGDKEYKCRYEHLHFDAGIQRLDGETALKYVRSRYAEGDEGTDTARALRQQKVVAALKAKLTSPQIMFSLDKLKSLRVIFETRVKSDLTEDDYFNLGRIFLGPSSRKMESFVVDGWQTGEDGLVYHPQTHPSGQWVLLPSNDSWERIHQFVNCLIYQENKSLCPPEKKQGSRGV